MVVLQCEEKELVKFERRAVKSNGNSSLNTVQYTRSLRLLTDKVGRTRVAVRVLEEVLLVVRLAVKEGTQGLHGGGDLFRWVPFLLELVLDGVGDP